MATVSHLVALVDVDTIVVFHLVAGLALAVIPGSDSVSHLTTPQKKLVYSPSRHVYADGGRCASMLICLALI